MRDQLDPGLTIVIPIYNEEESLLRLEQAVGGYLDKASMDCDVLMVDDGSTDRSLDMMKAICQRDRRFKYISFQSNCGLSAAIKAGFDHVQREWTGYMDSDLQTTPDDFEVLWAHKDLFDLVTGIRVKREDSTIKKLSSSFANGFRRLFTHDGMADTGCPLKIIKTSVAQKIPMFKGLHRFLPAMVLLQEGKIHQIEVRHFPRQQGQSKFHVANRLLGPLADCFAFLWMKRKYIHYQIAETNDA
jgi:glycosyltransferase involved in cell wall biosynthesis